MLNQMNDNTHKDVYMKTNKKEQKKKFVKF